MAMSWIAMLPLLFAAPDGASECAEGAGGRPERLLEEGRASYARGELDEAIERWSRAYAVLPLRGECAWLESELAWSLVVVHDRAHDETADAFHAEASQRILRQHREMVVRLDPDPAHRADELARIDHVLEARTGASADRALRGPTRMDESSSRSLRIGGGIALGIGGIGFMVSVAGIGLRHQALREFEPPPNASPEDVRRARRQAAYPGTAMAISGGFAGGVLLATGALLLLEDRHRRLDHQRLSLSPMASPHEAGLRLESRF